MRNLRWPVRVASATAWTIAALTWGSIGHYLFGLPDVGIPVAAIAVVTVLAPSLRAMNVAPSRRNPAPEAR